MPIPILKMKGQKKSPDEATESPQTRRTATTRTRPAAPNASSQIPSTMTASKEIKRPSKIATRPSPNMNNVKVNPRPPPRTSSVASSPMTSSRIGKASTGLRVPSTPKTNHVTPKNLSIPSPTTTASSACSSNRSSVVSTCSSIPAPSTSSSNRNSNSSIGSGFSIGSWNNNLDAPEPKTVPETKQANSETFPRSNNARVKTSTRQIAKPISSNPRTSSKPSSEKVKRKLNYSKLSSSESSISTSQKTSLPRPNQSETNLSGKVQSKILHKASRPEVMSKSDHARLGFGLSDSSDSYEELNKRGKKDIKRRENVALVAPFQPATEQRPSPEDDDGYGSVVTTDQTEDEEKAQKRNGSLEEEITDEIKPMKPLRLLQNFSHLKCLNDNNVVKEGEESHVSKSVSMEELDNPKSFNNELHHSLDETQLMKEIPLAQPFIPKPVSLALTTKLKANPQIKCDIDDSIYGVSYGKLVNIKSESILKKDNTTDMKYRTLNTAAKRKLAYGANAFPHIIPNRTETQNTEDKIIYQMPQVPDIQPPFNRSKSLRSPTSITSPWKQNIRYSLEEESTFKECSSPHTQRKNSFTRGANKYSTVIPRTSAEIQKNIHLSSFGKPYGHSNNLESKYIKDHPENSSSEVSNLRQDLSLAQEQIKSLTDQLNSKIKLIAAYEHSLTNMANRLQQLSTMNEKKDLENSDLKKLLERLANDGITQEPKIHSRGRRSMQRGSSIESLSSLASTDSISSTLTASSYYSDTEGGREKHKKRSWLRSSISKAFRKKDKRKSNDYCYETDVESIGKRYSRSISDTDAYRFSSLPSSPIPHRINSIEHVGLRISHPPNMQDEIRILKISLNEKDSALTEARLEVLSSSHQIESLKESMNKMTFELNSFKAQNEDQKEVSKRVRLLVSNTWKIEENANVIKRHRSCDDFLIGEISVTNKCSWNDLNNLVQNSFKSHINQIDPDNCTGLESGSLKYYRIGEIINKFEKQDLIPYGYFVGNVDWIKLYLNQTNFTAISYETLLPKEYLLKYVNSLHDNRRIILAGGVGSGKKFLAKKLAEQAIKRIGVPPSSANIATFQMTKHSGDELSVYLSQINHLCESKRSDLPLVIILESLETVRNFLDVLSSSLKVQADNCPLIICTYRLSDGNFTSVPSTCSFRWISLPSSQEYNRGMLQRICRRSSCYYKCSGKDQRMPLILEWLPRCFNLINSILVSANLYPIGYSMFLPLPASSTEAQFWFTNLWKLQILPKMKEAADVHSNSGNLNHWQELYKCLKEELPWSLLGSSDLFSFSFIS